ncbi:MAG: Uma2 family endonuclease [Myxococcales bacterium]|nr:Uma2 family endonuclease [Myxococcales bacterium]
MLQIIDGATGEGAVRIRPLRRVEYEHLAKGGAFDDEEIELIHGALVEVGTVDPWHDQVVAQAAARLRTQVAATGRVLVQTPLPLGEFSAPRPDLAVTTATSHWDGGRHRTLLVIEVAGASLDKDRGPKRLLAAHAPIDEYWIVDLEQGLHRGVR